MKVLLLIVQKGVFCGLHSVSKLRSAVIENHSLAPSKQTFHGFLTFVVVEYFEPGVQFSLSSVHFTF